MHFNPYGGVAAELAATLVNALVTADPPLSREALVVALREHGYRPAGVLDAADMTLLTAWAHRLAGVFAGDGDRVDSLNALLAESATQPYISRHDGRAPHLHFASEEGRMPDRLRAYTAAGLAHAFCQDPDRLGRCDRPGCGVVYVDTSRNGRRRFCSTRCANRVHVAGHRDRRAG